MTFKENFKKKLILKKKDCKKHAQLPSIQGVNFDDSIPVFPKFHNPGPKFRRVGKSLHNLMKQTGKISLLYFLSESSCTTSAT